MSHRLLFLPSTSRLSRWILPAWSIWVASCTLTGDDYVPVDVDALPVQPAAAPSAVTPDAGACSGGACSPPEPNAPAPSASESPPTPEGLTPGASGPEPMGLPSALPTCDDQRQNGNETAVDCGGECAACADGADCNTDADCQSVRCTTGRCAVASCDDGVQNGGEPSVDCGGPCPSCPTGRACSEPDDCQSAVCSAASGCAAGVAQCCQAPTCTDGVTNTNETDVDCGGECPSCTTGRACDDGEDCQSSVCGGGGCSDGVDQCCQAPSCDDGVRNGDEPIVDCGDLTCGPCALGSDCSDDAQCTTGFCDDGSCAELGTCTDGVQNGRETATDCGGGTCPRCADRLACLVADDCFNDNCFGNVCISCGSGVIDGTETDVDCGGSDPFCQRCAPGQRCLINGDCASNFCNNGFC